MRKAQADILLQEQADGSANLKKSQQQPGLLFVETRPREYALRMLPDLRAYCTEWIDRNEVPKELRGLLMSHVISTVAKAKYRRKK